MDLSSLKIGIIGCGNMGRALIKGLTSVPQAPRLTVWDPLADCRNRLAEEFKLINIASDNQTLVNDNAIIILAVKPQIIDPVMAEIKNALNPDKMLISIAAGIPCHRLEQALPLAIPTIRIMPNTPALINRGISAIAAGRHAGPGHLENAAAIFTCLGETVFVPESAMDMVTAVSGSGPAYVFLVIEALLDAAVGLGMARELARKLVLETLLGATELVKQSGRHPMELKDMVTSPGGTTIAGLAELEKNGLRHAFNEALRSACRRSQELGG
ncbi:MAG: pyrroline-5-carboxylate reductase [Deltaproteobacteria bacterium]|nr:pyrroline-5-carboxylate reductase [Deltaproteobacteria bacterium]